MDFSVKRGLTTGFVDAKRLNHPAITTSGGKSILLTFLTYLHHIYTLSPSHLHCRNPKIPKYMSIRNSSVDFPATGNPTHIRMADACRVSNPAVIKAQTLEKPSLPVLSITP
jgi:hypothetical protein